MEGILKKLQDAMYAGNKIEVERLAREALSGGIEPLKVIVVYMDEGKIVEEAPPTVMFSAPRKPETQRFLRSTLDR